MSDRVLMCIKKSFSWIVEPWNNSVFSQPFNTLTTKNYIDMAGQSFGLITGIISGLFYFRYQFGIGPNEEPPPIETQVIVLFILAPLFILVSGTIGLTMGRAISLGLYYAPSAASDIYSDIYRDVTLWRLKRQSHDTLMAIISLNNRSGNQNDEQYLPPELLAYIHSFIEGYDIVESRKLIEQGREITNKQNNKTNIKCFNSIHTLFTQKRQNRIKVGTDTVELTEPLLRVDSVL